MLPGSKRLTTSLFMKVMKEGKMFPSTFFILKAIKNQGISRFSVAVPKKVAKTAVERNKLRRRVYSALRIMDDSIKSGFCGVISVKIQVKNVKYEEMRASLRELFVKSGILK